MGGGVLQGAVPGEVRGMGGRQRDLEWTGRLLSLALRCSLLGKLERKCYWLFNGDVCNKGRGVGGTPRVTLSRQ